jgi:hypothetical protein
MVCHGGQILPADRFQNVSTFFLDDLPGVLNIFEGVRQIGLVEEEVFLKSAGLLDLEGLGIDCLHDLQLLADAMSYDQEGDAGHGAQQKQHRKPENDLGPYVHGGPFGQLLLCFGKSRFIQQDGRRHPFQEGLIFP